MNLLDENGLPIAGQGRTPEEVRDAGRVVACCFGLMVLIGVAKVGADLVLWVLGRLS